ncbi:hypothetical protein ACEQ8H_002639 [Pleosporales sp. CAS-2024a]
MSCWRLLQLSDQPNSDHIPQLLVKPVFGPDSYTVHVTCLTHIWSESLDLAGIVDRAAQEQSPIEVSKQDTTQLAILLANVQNALEHPDDAICRITQAAREGLTLHTTIALPKPLDSLTWTFHLAKREPTVLKNDLILPLLVSSHIQHARIAALVSTISDKDRAITRLLDQYESCNLDLAAAFPILSGLKTGKKLIKREQAARHVPALQQFHQHAFNKDTGHLAISDLHSLDLFQEALSDCVPDMSSKLVADVSDVRWWTGVPTHVSRIKTPSKTKAKHQLPVARATKPVADSSGDETEDEFETHSNFKTRKIPSATARASTALLLSKEDNTASDEDATEDDDDLDAPPKTQTQRSSQAIGRPPPPLTKSSSLEAPSLPKSPALLPAKPKPKGFRIGGKPKQVSPDPPLLSQDKPDTIPDAHDRLMKEPPSSQITAAIETTPKKAKRRFKIGGKEKRALSGDSRVHDAEPTMTDRTKASESPSIQPPSSPPVVPSPREASPVVEEELDETAEEKAERRRAELKRKTEEAAKKQAQGKKKRRF